MKEVGYLVMDNVSKAFGTAKALTHLSFEVEQGEIFGFLGPSGAGKTTTIKLLTHQLIADEGNILLFHRPLLQNTSSIYERIGILSDTNGCYERLSVQENLQLFAGIRDLRKSAIDDVLGRVNLVDARKKKVKQLSRGMLQRLMLACATIHRPELLFLDEPTAALDPGNVQQIHNMLLDLNAAGTTIFLTTHNMEEADRLCDRVAFLNGGEIVACDTPYSLKMSYAQNKIDIQTRSGKRITIEKSVDGLRALEESLSNDAILTIHSIEPTLEDVFLRLTRRNLYE